MNDLIRCLHHKLDLNYTISEEDEILIKLTHNIDLSLLRDDCTYIMKYNTLHRQIQTVYQQGIITCCSNFTPLTVKPDLKAHKQDLRDLHQLREYVQCLYNKALAEIKNMR